MLTTPPRSYSCRSTDPNQISDPLHFFIFFFLFSARGSACAIHHCILLCFGATLTNARPLRDSSTHLRGFTGDVVDLFPLPCITATALQPRNFLLDKRQTHKHLTMSEQHHSGDELDDYKEQDRFLPIANVARIMKKALPDNAKIAKEAKECVQECVSEFISFITSEGTICQDLISCLQKILSRCCRGRVAVRCSWRSQSYRC